MNLCIHLFLYHRLHSCMKSYLVLDLDDTCFNLRDVLYQSLARQTGCDIHWKNWDQYFLPNIFPCTADEMFSQWISDQVLENCTLEPQLHEVLTYAKQLGLNVVALTARGWHPDGYALTCQFIERHNLSFDEIHVIDHSITKAAYMQKHFKHITAFVDDHADHFRNAQHIGINSFLVNRPWNKHYDIPTHLRLDSIGDLLKHL